MSPPRPAELWGALLGDVLDALEAAACGETHCGHLYCPEAPPLTLCIHIMLM